MLGLERLLKVRVYMSTLGCCRTVQVYEYVRFPSEEACAGVCVCVRSDLLIKHSKLIDEDSFVVTFMQT